MLRTKFKCRNFHAFWGFIQPCVVERSEFRFVYCTPKTQIQKMGNFHQGSLEVFKCERTD